jgi:hypothetical protein
VNRFNAASGRHPFPDGFFCLRRVIRGDDPISSVRAWVAAGSADTRTKIAPAMLLNVLVIPRNTDQQK